jgi:hypothetical protein
MVLLTNHLRLVASTVAAVYWERWQVEQFFRALKQSLRIKTFVGTSANAVLVQIWTALIAMLLLLLRTRISCTVFCILSCGRQESKQCLMSLVRGLKLEPLDEPLAVVALAYFQ